MSRPDFEITKVTVTAQPRKLDATWTVEEGDMTSVVASCIVESYSPDLHSRVVAHLGHDRYFLHRQGDSPFRLATGDPLCEGEVVLHDFDLKW